MPWSDLRWLAMDTGFNESDHPRGEGGKFSVTKQGNKHVVSGHLHGYSNGGKTFGSEPYQRAFKTQREAEFHAQKLHKQNQETLADRSAMQAERKKKAESYLAQRKARSSGQKSLFDSMPKAIDILTQKGEKIKSALQKEYGSKRGESILYAGKNKGTFTGIDEDMSASPMQPSMTSSQPAMDCWAHMSKWHGKPATDEHLGFAKLENKLAHKSGISNPAAVAASIGRKKYGEAEMAKKSAAGRDALPMARPAMAPKPMMAKPMMPKPAMAKPAMAHGPVKSIKHPNGTTVSFHNPMPKPVQGY